MNSTLLTKLNVRAGLAALEGVQNQKANFEEKAVWAHIETTHFVEAVAAHHQRNDAYSFTQHINVVNYPIDSCLRSMKTEVNILGRCEREFRREFMKSILFK